MSSTEEALLAVIAAMPEEDTPRLALADYLDETGDELAAARAEFIRLQVALSGVTSESTETLAARVRAAELRERYAKAWGFVPQSATNPWYAVRRGFVGEIVIDSPCPPRNALQRLFRREPVGQLRIVRPCDPGGWVSPSNAADWLDVPALRRVRRLELSGSYWSDREVARVLGFANFPALAQLTLTGAPLTAAGVAAIAGCEQLRDLERLRIDDTRQWSNEVKGWAGGIALPGIRALTGAVHFAGLWELSLRAAGIEVAGAFALAASPHLTGLKTLDLRQNPGIGGAGRAELVARFGSAALL